VFAGNRDGFPMHEHLMTRQQQTVNADERVGNIANYTVGARVLALICIAVSARVYRAIAFASTSLKSH
jgi:hypothetical protein